MRKAKRQTIIVLIAMSSTLFGSWLLIKCYSSLFYIFKDLKETIKIIGLARFIFSVFLSLFLPIFLIIGSIGLFFMKSWGILITLISLTTDFLIRLIGIIRFFYCSYFIKEPQPVFQKGYTIVISMVPDYIIVLLEAVVLYFLCREFKHNKTITQKNQRTVSK